MLSFLLEDGAQIVALSIVHTLVVDLRQGIQLLAQGRELLLQLRILQFGQLAQVGILGVQGEYRDAGVGIGVGPGVSGRGVVDGQHLQQTLMGASHPVDHQPQITEVTHAERAFRTKREHRHKRSCHSLIRDGEEGLVEMIHLHVAATEVGGHVKFTVLTGLPERFLSTHRHKLHLYTSAGKGCCIEDDNPLVVVVLGHGHCLLKVPIA